LTGFFDSLRLEVGQDVQITLICPGKFILTTLGKEFSKKFWLYFFQTFFLLTLVLTILGFVLSDFHEKAIGIEGENKIDNQRERKFDAKNYMTPEQCAELIVHAEQDGTRELVRPTKQHTSFALTNI